MIISKPERVSLNSAMTKIYLTLEYPRSNPMRSLDELTHWKAVEFKAFVLHSGPLLLKEYLMEDEFNHFLSLSAALKLLLKPKLSELDLTMAEKLLEFFNDQIVDLLGENGQTYNMHSLRHLVWQSRRSGSLAALSAFSFESAHHFLKSLLTGTVNQGQLLVERFLLKQSLYMVSIKDDAIETMTTSLVFSSKTYFPLHATKVPTEVRVEVLKHTSNPIFLGRHRFSEFLVHSRSYSKARGIGNSVVMFVIGDTYYFRECLVFVKDEALLSTMALIAVFEAENAFDSIRLASHRIPSNMFMLCTPGHHMEWVNVVSIKSKCCVCPKNNGSVLISVMTEGFEHD